MRKALPLALLAALLIFTGCQTSLSAMKPGATQLVIPLDNEKENGANPFGSYFAVISSIGTQKEAGVVRLSPSDQYALAKNIKPGEYYISQTYFQFTEDKEIPDSERKFFEEDFAPFTLEEGAITLCPVVFSTATSKGSGFKMPLFMDLSSFKDKGGKRGWEVLKLLQAKYPEEYASWKIRE